MIKKENFAKALVALGFTQENKKWVRQFRDDTENKLTADFENETLAYPQNLKINRDTITNFSANENFVVFECVARLLAKGYQPENIELESKIPGGHDSVVGWNDIRITDNNGKTFLLIECKTSDEFDTYWNKTLTNGSQLFNYFNTFRDADALCLYASDWTDEAKLSYNSNIISMQDNDEYLESNKSLASFRSVSEKKAGKEEYFNVWVNTYQRDFDTAGIFEDDVEIYRIGKKKYTASDLKEPEENSIQKKYHEFTTIMRRHNVGSHENAFDKLVNLFLAKIVDESTNASELQFRWRGAAHDDYFRFQDRLQKLYKAGMKEFLGEEITYIEQREVEEAFHFFKNDPDATKDKILYYFKQLKFFTNSDFAFLDVHNETLFYKNAAILKEMVQMLQDMKLKTDNQNQFLGDLFEGFLDQGVKQNEGQYLTPMPIVKFLVSSLPLKSLTETEGRILKAIDYACGAGHFLTEYAAEIKELAKKIPGVDVKEYNRRTFGIEKEYRLSKVAKVSAFMYGHEEIEIVYGDALAANEKIKDNSFDVLIANPPYSVKGFLETLTEDDRLRFTLTAKVRNIPVNNSIETFFVERAKQLLTGGGVAAIILPSSILSKGGIYKACREILLKYFHIVAIAAFGSGAFGKTGTNTVTLFLRRRDSNPEAAEHYKNRINAWFNADITKDKIFEDSYVINEYCALCKLDADKYRAWLLSEKMPDAPIFAAYEEAAKKTNKYEKIAKKEITAEYTEEQKFKDLSSYVNSFIKPKEREKLYYFMLASDSPVPVVIVKCPDDKTGQKLFLGYEWSGRKGDEGIKYIGADNLLNIKTPLFNPQNLDDEAKINTIIRRNFEGETVLENLPEFVSKHRLIDLMDFSGVEFDKTIKLTSNVALILGVNYFDNKELKRLDSLCEMNLSKSAVHDVDDNVQVSFIDMASVSNDGYIEKMIDRPIGELRMGSYTYFAENDILLAKITPCMENGKCAIAKNLTNNIGFGSSEFHTFRCNTKELLSEYLFVILNQDYVRKVAQSVMTGASGHRRVPASFYANMIIPVPPIEIQQQIVSEFNDIDAKIKVETETIEKCADEVKAKFEEMFGGKDFPTEKLGNICEVARGGSPRPIEQYITDAPNGINWIKIGDADDSIYITHTEQKIKPEGLKKSRYVQVGDFLLSNSMSFGRPYILKINGCIHDGWLVLKYDKSRLEELFFHAYLSLPSVYDKMKELSSGSVVNNLNTNVIKTLPIPLPPLALQKEFAAYAEMCDEKKKAASMRKEELIQQREQLIGKYFR